MAKKNDNLDDKGFDKLTAKEQRKIASMGGKASAEARRKKRDLRLAMEMLLEQDITGKDGTVKSGAEAIAVQQFKKALKGDSKAFEIIRDTSGQSVVQKIAVAEVDESVLKEVEDMVLNDDD
jgi:hypothetical protein